MDTCSGNFLVNRNFKIEEEQLVVNKWTDSLDLASPPARGEGFIGLINRIVRFFYKFIYTLDQIKVLEKVDETLNELSKEQEYFKNNKVTLKK